jgi:hypothetical protein
MFNALRSTITELLDSKKAAYGFAATIAAAVLHVYFGVSVEDALMLVSPLGVALVGQAHVDAAVAKSSTPAAPANVQTTVVNEPGAAP